MTAARPNVILINCDDLGYGDLGCYGSAVNDTPAIDAIAAGGMILTDFYMASPVCSPSRGGMLTGCYPPRIGFGTFEGPRDGHNPSFKHWVLFPGFPTGLSRGEETIADVLRGAGYRTKMVGKWHCGDQPEFLPTRHGFDEYFGLPYSNDMGRQANGQDNPPLPLLEGERVVQEQPDQRALCERYVERSLEFIGRPDGRPFFLYLAPMHVHLPLYAAEPFVAASRNGDYGACVASVDWAVACILKKLKDERLAERTIVILTSDNGSRGDNGGSNAPLRGGKFTTWEGGMRVPCVMHWPGTIKPGTVRGDIVSSIDLLPTLAALCGAGLRSGNTIDGIDLSGTLFGGPEPKAGRDAFFYYRGTNLEAVREGDWKLHVHKGNEPVRLLYNLREDVGETTDRSAERPELVERLGRLLEGCRLDLGDTLTGAVGANVRTVGYAEGARPLTAYDESHPYIIAEYDKGETG